MLRYAYLVSSRLGQLDRCRMLQRITVVEDSAAKTRRLRCDRAHGLDRGIDHCLKGVFDQVHKPEPGRVVSCQILTEQKNSPRVAEADELRQPIRAHTRKAPLGKAPQRE